MRYAVIIEDERSEFNTLKEIFKSSSWEVLPKSYEDISHLFCEEKKNELLKSIRVLIEENYESIRIIILDVSLWGRGMLDTFGIDGVLKLIRELDIEENNTWSKQVPIIAYSRHDALELKRKALSSKHHVHTYITKADDTKNKQELLLTAESLSSIFSLNIEAGGFQDNINRMYDSLKNMIISHDEGVETKLNQMEIFLKGEIEHIKNGLDIVLYASLTQLDASSLDDIIGEFQDQLIDVAGMEKTQSIKNKIEKPDIREQFKKFLKSGQFSDFVDFSKDLIKELHEEDIIDFLPGGRILCLGLSSILKIISKSY